VKKPAGEIRAETGSFAERLAINGHWAREAGSLMVARTANNISRWAKKKKKKKKKKDKSV